MTIGLLPGDNKIVKVCFETSYIENRESRKVMSVKLAVNSSLYHVSTNINEGTASM